MVLQNAGLRLQGRLETGPPMLLDGAMGTELLRRGWDVSLPLWSAAVLQSNPEAVLDIHQDYVASGAEILTTNTFRTTPRAFFKVMEDEEVARRRARKLTRRAVKAAKAAAGNHRFVAGCMAPLEDCYKPELFPGSTVAEKEFSELSGWLVREEVDLLLIETMGSISEAMCALKATADVSIPRWISFILRDNQHLLNGEELIDAAKMSVDSGANVFLINCTNLYTSVQALENLKGEISIPTGIYPNLGKSMPTAEGTIDELYTPVEFIEQMKRAIDLGADIIGSCCGSGPDHTTMLGELIDSFS